MPACQFGHVLGDQQRCYVSPEATGGTFAPAVAGPPTNLVGGAIRVMSTDIQIDQPFEPRDDAQDGRGEYEYEEQKRTITVTIETAVIPPTALTQRPDVHWLLVAVFGAHTFTSGVSTVYSLGDLVTCTPLSFTRLLNADNAIAAEGVAGLILNEWTLNISGTEKPKMTWTGQAMQHYGVSNATALAGSAGEVNLTSPAGGGFEAGGPRIQLGADDNAGAGWAISAATLTRLTVPGGPALAGGEAIRPFAPTPVLSAQPVIGHTVGSLTMDGVEWPVSAAQVTLSNNYDYIADEYGQSGMSDAQVGKRTIRGQITIRERADLVIEHIRRKLRANRDLRITMGTGAGRTWILDADRVVFDLSGRTLPNAGKGSVTLPFKARDSAEGANNALQLTVQ